MKQIIVYINECTNTNIATPMNTPGMGNPSAPDNNGPGSGDIPVGTKLNKRKMKHIKDFLKKNA